MKNNEKAIDAFIGTLVGINDHLDSIQKYMEDHMGTSPDNINWGHVGSARKVYEELDNIMEFLGLN